MSDDLGAQRRRLVIKVLREFPHEEYDDVASVDSTDWAGELADELLACLEEVSPW